MNKYLDFESDIEILDNKISELHINDSNFINEKNKLTEKKNTILKKKIFKFISMGKSPSCKTCR